jgi:hypothetical protein
MKSRALHSQLRRFVESVMKEDGVEALLEEEEVWRVFRLESDFLALTEEWATEERDMNEASEGRELEYEVGEKRYGNEVIGPGLNNSSWSSSSWWKLW